MGRWEPDARGRLERAALDLFRERGFGETTVPEIAERAGLTTRTFFRYFADKREVLFAYEADFPELVTGLVVDAPAELGPLDVVARGLDVIARTRFEPQREKCVTHAAIVAGDEALRERDLQKRSLLATAVREGLEARGVNTLTARITAELAVSVLYIALERWLADDSGAQLADLVAETLGALTALAR